jgi:hypothetical protein
MGGVSKMELNFGKLKILGDHSGGQMGILKFKKEKMHMVLKEDAYGLYLMIHGLKISGIKQFLICRV